MSRTITFQPGKELGEFIEEVIASGDYHNQSEVIREGLRLLREKNARSRLTELRRLIDAGDNSGHAVPWDAKKFLSRMKELGNKGNNPANPMRGKRSRNDS